MSDILDAIGGFFGSDAGAATLAGAGLGLATKGSKT